MKGPAETQVISKSYLSGLIIKCSLFFGTGLVLTGIILYFSAHQPLGPSYQESFARLSQLKQEMLYKSIIIYSTMMLIIVAGVIFTTVIYSHRVIGPMIGLKRIIGYINSFDLRSPAILRKKDAIKPMADALNNMMKTYKDIIVSIGETTDELREISSQPVSSEQRRILAEKAGKISHTINQLKLS